MTTTKPSPKLKPAPAEVLDRAVGCIYGSLSGVSGRKAVLTTKELKNYWVRLRFPYKAEEHEEPRNWLAYPRTRGQDTVLSLIRVLPRENDKYNYFVISGTLSAKFPPPAKGGVVTIVPKGSPEFDLNVFLLYSSEYEIGQRVEYEARLVGGGLQARNRQHYFPSYK